MKRFDLMVDSHNEYASGNLFIVKLVQLFDTLPKCCCLHGLRPAVLATEPRLDVPNFMMLNRQDDSGDSCTL